MQWIHLMNMRLQQPIQKEQNIIVFLFSMKWIYRNIEKKPVFRIYFPLCVLTLEMNNHSKYFSIIFEAFHKEKINKEKYYFQFSLARIDFTNSSPFYSETISHDECEEKNSKKRSLFISKNNNQQKQRSFLWNKTFQISETKIKNF